MVEEPAPTPFDADVPGIEIEVTPAGKATKRLSLLSGGEKSLVALAFMFAVFLARPCPFYILDEVEAALDDSNIDRFLQLVGALLRPLAVHRDHPPAPHDGGGGRALRRQHGQRRRLEGRVAQARGRPEATRRSRGPRRVVVHRGARRRPEVALTYDDGPGASTRAVLELLERARRAATFFMVGSEVAARPRPRHGGGCGRATRSARIRCTTSTTRR